MISIHALHEESDFSEDISTQILRISIHALHEESDENTCYNPIIDKISIHALHEESDTIWVPSIKNIQFQSTLSMRRATRLSFGLAPTHTFQSTLSMRRATVQLDIFVRFLRRKPAA